jgi:hypothetical protein
MESFLKALQELKDLVKATRSKSSPQMHPELPKMPEIKPISSSSISASSVPKPTKMPGINPGSKKDPAKVAQQLKSGKAQSQKMPLLKFNKGGQWSLD